MRSLIAKLVIAIIILTVLGVGVFGFVNFRQPALVAPSLIEKPKDLGPRQQVLGTSVEGRDITAYIYGNGKTLLLFVGGMHGGYEWNSVLIAYQFMDYLKENTDVVVPKNLTITVIPSANPDGVYAVIGKEGRFSVTDIPIKKGVVGLGRFNAHGVDLNRNFDCQWQPTSLWKAKKVSAGSGVFSEPETMAIRDFVLENSPKAVVFWHSQANAVYASKCEAGVLPLTFDIMNAYSRASGYPAVKSFDSYEITGDAEGWLASINIPAITVELKTHETIEWEQNLSGIKALFEYYKYYNQKTE